MKKRFQFKIMQPKAYEAMDALENFVSESSIDKKQAELVKIRASQINGCAFCVDMHSQDALGLGETLQRVLLVSAWREAENVFSEEERLLFQMTEEITLIHQHGVSDETYTKAIATFGEEKTAQFIMAIITVNAWNRIGVATKLQLPVRKRQLVTNN